MFSLRIVFMLYVIYIYSSSPVEIAINVLHGTLLYNFTHYTIGNDLYSTVYHCVLNAFMDIQIGVNDYTCSTLHLTPTTTNKKHTKAFYLESVLRF